MNIYVKNSFCERSLEGVFLRFIQEPIRNRRMGIIGEKARW